MSEAIRAPKGNTLPKSTMKTELAPSLLLALVATGREAVFELVPGDVAFAPAPEVIVVVLSR